MINLVLIAICVLAVLAGGVLAWRGLYRSRRGTTPFCRACGYNLSGRSSEGCSECGADLSRPKSIVIGERFAHRRRLLIGVVFLAVGLIVGGRSVYSSLQRVNWYAYYPVSWLLADLASGSWAVASSAGIELWSRLHGNRLSPQDVELIVAAGLREQAAPTTSDIESDMEELLTELALQSRMSIPERRQFLRNLVQFSVDSYPFAIRGQRFPAQVICHSLSSNSRPKLFMKITILDWRIRDDLQKADVAMSWRPVFSGGAGARQFDTPAGDRFDLEVRMSVEFSIGSDAPPPLFSDDPLIFSAVTHLKVLQNEPDNFPQLFRSAEEDAAMVAGTTIESAWIEPNPGPGRAAQACLYIVFGPKVPTPFAFRVFVDGQAVQSAGLLYRQANSIDPYVRSVTYPLSHPATCTITLVPDRRIVESKNGMDRIGGGTLVFENVQFSREGPPALPPAKSYPKPRLGEQPASDATVKNPASARSP